MLVAMKIKLLHKMGCTIKSLFVGKCSSTFTDISITIASCNLQESQNICDTSYLAYSIYFSASSQEYCTSAEAYTGYLWHYNVYFMSKHFFSHDSGLKEQCWAF